LNKFSSEAMLALNQKLADVFLQHEQLQSWVIANAPSVGSGLIIGSIVWSKALGRPATPHMRDGFDIGLYTTMITGIGAPGSGSVVETPITTGPIPVDQKSEHSDGERHWVNFVTTMPGNIVRFSVKVAFASGGWQDASGGSSTEHLLITPSERGSGKPPFPNWIAPFSVVRAIDHAVGHQ
jgi:hypothetical protein